MRRNIILIIAVLIISFVALTYYGLRHSRGVPVHIEKPAKVTIEVPFVDREIDLSRATASDIWSAIAGKEVALMHQLTVLPWPRSLTSPIWVRAFHNGRDIYFDLTWQDQTQDTVLDMNQFSDACAIMFPLSEEPQPSSIMMGFIGRANIWQWKAAQDREYWMKELPLHQAYADYYYPFEGQETLSVSKTQPKAAVNDLVSVRVGTVTPKDTQEVQGRGAHRNGAWDVVFRRTLDAADSEVDAQFRAGKNRLCAFAVWNGSNGDRGGRKSISDWVELEIK